MDVQNAATRHLQEVKILHDIKRLLASIESLKMEENVLASDDLYPEDTDSGSQKYLSVRSFGRVKPVRSQSMHCRSVQLPGRTSAHQHSSPSSGSPSNQSSSSTSACVSHKMRPAVPQPRCIRRHVSMQRNLSHFPCSKNIQSTNNGQPDNLISRFIADTRRESFSKTYNSKDPQNIVRPEVSQTSPVCSKEFTPRDIDVAASSTQSVKDHVKNEMEHVPNVCSPSNQASSIANSKMEHPSFYSMHRLQRSDGKKSLSTGSGNTSTDSGTECSVSIEELLDGRSLFACASTSRLYFRKNLAGRKSIRNLEPKSSTDSHV